MKRVKEIPSLSFTQSFKVASEKILQLTGRSRRSEYWWPMLVVTLVSCFLPIVGFVLSVLMIPVTFRRLHDTGHSGWWWGVSMILSLFMFGLLVYDLADIVYNSGRSVGSEEYLAVIAKYAVLFIICFLYQIVLLIFLCLDSDKHENRYGPSPKYIEIDESSADTNNVNV